VGFSLRKALALFRVWMQDGIAYRAAGVIWILADGVPAMIMPLVWIAAVPEGGTIGGFTAQQFVLYYLVLLLFSNFITSHLMWELAEDIKNGTLSIHLLRPVSYFQVCSIRNFVWRLLRTTLFAPIFGLLLLAYWRNLDFTGSYFGWQVWLSVFLGHLVSYSLVYMLSMLALFLEEARAVFEFYYFPMLFLSGQLFPIHLLPEWASRAATYLPFYYTTALPTDLAVGRVPVEGCLPLLLVQAGWIFAHFWVATLLWKPGLRQYTGVGM